MKTPRITANNSLKNVIVLILLFVVYTAELLQLLKIKKRNEPLFPFVFIFFVESLFPEIYFGQYMMFLTKFQLN